MEEINLPKVKANFDGGKCIFYRVGKSGLKIWISYGLAMEQCVNQTRASKYSCGPKVLSEIVKTKCGWYGFYTELAILHKPHSYKDLVNLKRRFKRAFGINYPDLHDGNIGHVNGKLMFIDFDRLKG